MIADLSPFRKLFNLGYERLVPIVPPDATISPQSMLKEKSRGKAVGIKGADGLWRGISWHQAPTPSLAELDAWASMGAGVGIRTGHGLAALDIDSLDPFITKRATELAAQMLGAAPIRIGRAPKCLLVYRTTEPVQYQRVEFSGHEGNLERIELLAEGRQFVADGIHPVTKAPYSWPLDVPALAELQTVTPQQLDAYFTALAQSLPKAVKAELSLATDRTHVNQEALKGDIDLVTQAVRALPNTSDLFPTYDDYIRVGAAIKGATQHDPNAGLELFLEWAEKWDGANDLDAAAKDYHRIKPPYALGAAWLYDHADRYSGGLFSVASAWFEPQAPEPIFAQDSPPESHKQSRFTPVIADAAAEQALVDSQQPLIKGLLDQGAMTVLYGASNVGKTFVAMDIAYCIAAGINWGGMRTTQLPVLYVAAEGGRGAKRRVKALQLKYGRKGVPFYLIMDSVDMLRPDADLEHLVLAAAGLPQRPGLIVIDTLSRAIAGGDENSSTDMGALVKNLDTLRSRVKAHVLTVHHSGKDAARGARGHSLLRAATDTEIEVADNVISVTKQRDMDGIFRSGFKLTPHELGHDADGDPVTSCSIELVASGEAEPTEAATPAEREVLDILSLLIETSAGAVGVKMRDILSAMKESKPDMTAENVRSILRRLGTKCLIKRVDKGLWAPKSGQNRLTATHPERFLENEAVKSGQKSGQTIFD